MTYFGDTKLPKNDKYKLENRYASFQEYYYKEELVKHVLLALATLQHNGSLVLKLYETHSTFTAAVLYILYTLFNQVSIVKPFTTNFLSPRKYVVCKGLKQRRPKDAIMQLSQLLKRDQIDLRNP